MANMLGITIVALIIGCIIYACVRIEKKRVTALNKMALQLGFRFDREGSGEHSGQFFSLPLFQRGRATKLKNCLIGKLGGRELAIGDYRYSTGSGKSRRTYNQTVAMVTVGKLLPEFVLSPENFLHKIAGSLGYQDFDFNNFPQFSSKYLLRGPAEQSVRQIFSPSVIKYFEDNLGWSVEANGNKLLIYRASKRVDPASIPVLIREVTGIVERLG